MSIPKSIPDTIEAQDLASLTGLSDRRHRQLAERGYMPMPVRGVYKLRPAVAGIVKYYQQRAKAEDPLRKARQEEIKSRTKLNNLTIAARQRTMVPVAEAVQVLGKFLSEAKGKIYGHPKLEQEEKDALLECLGQCLDVAFTQPPPQDEPEGRAQAEATD